MLPGLQAQPMYLRGRQSFQAGQNPLGKAGAAAIFSPRTKQHPCRIHTGLTASVASPVIAVVIATV